MPGDQNFKNHTRVYPLFHIWTFFPLLVNFLWSLYRLRFGITPDSVVAVILAFGLLAFFGAVRRQVLTVQDRVIRLEMRLRLRETLPPDVAAQAARMSIQQLIALRFASDAELPLLVREVLAGTVATPKDIKQRVKDWQGDYLRA
jgi:Family of unknown function (DUF6526)